MFIFVAIEEVIISETEPGSKAARRSLDISMTENEKREVRENCQQLLKEINIPLPANWLLKDDPPDIDNDDSASVIGHEMEPILFSQEFEESDDKRAFLSHHCVIDSLKIIDIASRTVGQFQNPLYCKMRHLRITASNFGYILEQIQKSSYPPSLFKTLLGFYFKMSATHPEKVTGISLNRDSIICVLITELVCFSQNLNHLPGEATMKT